MGGGLVARAWAPGSICGSGNEYGFMDTEGRGVGFFLLLRSGVLPGSAVRASSPKAMAKTKVIISIFFIVAYPPRYYVGYVYIGSGHSWPFS